MVSMSYSVHKVTPVHSKKWTNSKFLCDLAKKNQENVKVKTTGHIILANCSNRDRRSKSNSISNTLTIETKLFDTLVKPILIYTVIVIHGGRKLPHLHKKYISLYMQLYTPQR